MQTHLACDFLSGKVQGTGVTFRFILNYGAIWNLEKVIYFVLKLNSKWYSVQADKRVNCFWCIPFFGVWCRLRHLSVLFMLYWSGRTGKINNFSELKQNWRNFIKTNRRIYEFEGYFSIWSHIDFPISIILESFHCKKLRRILFSKWMTFECNLTNKPHFHWAMP